METQKFDFSFKEIKKFSILTCAKVLKSPYLRQYQSYSCSCYINGKVFMSATTLIGLLSYAIHKYSSSFNI